MRFVYLWNGERAKERNENIIYILPNDAVTVMGNRVLASVLRAGSREATLSVARIGSGPATLTGGAGATGFTSL